MATTRTVAAGTVYSVSSQYWPSAPWFHINTNDIFPEEFPNFLGLNGPLRDVFEAHHRDLYTAGYWRARQDAIRAGERAHIYPYQAGQRLHQGV